MAAIAGCLGDDGVTSSGDDSSDSDGGSSHGNGGDSEADVAWPAIANGELISDFEEGSAMEPLIGTLEGSPDEARAGSQALVVESDEDRAGVALFFPDGLDLDGWDASMAVKAEAIDRIAIEFHAPSFGDHLTSFRRLPNEHDDWMRVDFGYDEKQGEPNLTNVTELRIIGFDNDGGPTRFLVDDLRRTEAVANGKAIVVCYGGHLSHLEMAASMLAEREWPAAVAMDPRRVGGTNRMDRHDLRELSERGWDISPAPRGDGGLTGLPEGEQRSIIETARDAMAENGFRDGARHYFSADWRSMDPTTQAAVRDLHETAFVFGSSTSGVPPTGPHLIPVSWGPALHSGIRRQINIADQYQLLVVLRIPPLVEDQEEVNEGSEMWVGDFEHLLDHIEHRGLDVITPSDLVDGTFAGDGSEDSTTDRPEGTILESGRAHAFEGDGTGETPAFDVDAGLLFASFTHDRTDPFAIDIEPIDGQVPNDVLARTAGHRSGESVLAIERGEYRLAVDAEGSWLVEVYQPAIHSDDLQELPLERIGAGSGLVGPFWTAEDGSIRAVHDGDGDFIVDMYSANGAREQIVNTTGTFESTRSFVADASAWLNVEASGEWTITVQ